MASMKTKQKTKRLSEEDVDALVVAEAGVESAWSKPVKVRKTKTESLSLPSSLLPGPRSLPDCTAKRG